MDICVAFLGSSNVQEVTMPDLPPLIASMPRDLAVISAEVQDALVACRRHRLSAELEKIRFDRGEVRLGEGGTENAGVALLRALPHRPAFRTGSQSLVPWVPSWGQGAYPQSLNIRFTPADPPAGVVEFIFSAGRAIRLEVECLEAEIRDLGPRWTARSAPNHRLDDGQENAPG